jgi:hypothetical protein
MDLEPYPLGDALKALSGAAPGLRLITMGAGQWDSLLAAAYAQGWILVEMDTDGHPSRAYRTAAPDRSTRLDDYT